MTLQWIPLDALEDHPENTNRMPPHLVEKLQAHIARTGRYEPLVVRPMPGIEANGDRSLALAGEARNTPRYQILNGHHRARVLRDLGHTHARCDVWEVDDEEARLLLATLNRLEGRDDPSARAVLVSRLSEGRSDEDLARLLPEPPDAVARLRKLAEPPPPPADPDAASPLPRPMTFFLDEDQAATVREALGAARGATSLERKRGDRSLPLAASGGQHPSEARPGSAEALVRLAQWYLEARGRR